MSCGHVCCENLRLIKEMKGPGRYPPILMELVEAHGTDEQRVAFVQWGMWTHQHWLMVETLCRIKGRMDVLKATGDADRFREENPHCEVEAIEAAAKMWAPDDPKRLMMEAGVANSRELDCLCLCAECEMKFDQAQKETA